MKPEHEERFRRIADDYLDRPGGDYAELLARGEVSSADGVDPEQWRAEIRSNARAAKIRVITLRSGDRALAVRRIALLLARPYGLDDVVGVFELHDNTIGRRLFLAYL